MRLVQLVGRAAVAVIRGASRSSSRSANRLSNCDNVASPQVTSGALPEPSDSGSATGVGVCAGFAVCGIRFDRCLHPD